MTERLQVYKCNVCGNIVEVLRTGVGELVCCEQPMELHQEKADDVGQEKHVPVIETTEGGVRVKVGSIPHPMEGKHHIEWVEIVAYDEAYRKFLRPGDISETDFRIKPERVNAREYYNVHGLWKSAG